MGIIIDIILLAIIALSAYLAWRKGFARVLIEAVGYIVALVLAFTLSGVIAPAIYDNFISPNIASQAENIFADLEQDNNIGNGITLSLNMETPAPNFSDIPNIDDIDMGDFDIENVELPQNLSLADIQTAFENLPENLTGIANNFDITPERIYAIYQEQIASGATNVNLTTIFVDDIIGSSAIMVIRGIIMVVLMVVFMIIVRIASKFISAILFKTPVASTANRVLGALFGILRGLIFAILIALALVPILYLTTENAEAVVSNSVVLSLIENILG